MERAVIQYAKPREGEIVGDRTFDEANELLIQLLNQKKNRLSVDEFIDLAQQSKDSDIGKHLISFY